MVLIATIQAGCFTAIKAGLKFAPPLLFAGMRAVIGGTALLALVVVQRRRPVPPRSTWPGLLILSLVAIAITFGAMFLSPGRTEAGIASAAGNLQPFLTLVLAYFWLSEPLTANKAIAAALGVLGVALISYPALTGSSALGISGVGLALAVSFGSAVGNVLVKRMRLGHLLVLITAWSLILGGSLLLVLSWLVESGPALDLNLKFLGLLLFLALVGTAFITALWYTFVQEGEAGRLATFFYLVPVFGLAIAALAFHEPLGPLTLLGALLILVAVGFVLLEKPAVGAKILPQPVSTQN